jgi:hypothetical protein
MQDFGAKVCEDLSNVDLLSQAELPGMLNQLIEFQLAQSHGSAS